MSILRRRRRGPAAPAAPLSRRPNVGLLRRERRSLLGVQERKLAELGGLTVEMYRFGSWRSDLLQERCAELVGIEARLADIDALLGSAPAAETARCICGAALRSGAQFCSNCGRTVARRPDDGAPDDTIVSQRPAREG